MTSVNLIRFFQLYRYAKPTCTFSASSKYLAASNSHQSLHLKPVGLTFSLENNNTLAKYLECNISTLNINAPTKDKEEDGDCPQIFSGEIICDRKSSFQPHLAEVHSIAEVKLVLKKLNENKKIAKATHNIYAYRFCASDSNALFEDSDDDGERNAGERMLRLLQILDLKNVLVVVSRWYGGIKLGPNRFKHINNAARQILLSCDYIKTKEDKKKKSKKK